MSESIVPEPSCAKHKVAELIELALIYAIQDRQAMADACHSADPEYARAAALVEEFEGLLLRRYGRLTAQAQDRRDVLDGKMRFVRIEDLEELPHDGSTTKTPRKER